MTAGELAYVELADVVRTAHKYRPTASSRITGSTQVSELGGKTALTGGTAAWRFASPGDVE